MFAVRAIVFLVQRYQRRHLSARAAFGHIGGTMSLIQRVQSLPEADPLLFRLS